MTLPILRQEVNHVLIIIRLLISLSWQPVAQVT